MASAAAPRLFLLYLLITMYAVCYQLQSPLEPFLVQQLVNADAAASTAATSKLTKANVVAASASSAADAYARLQSFFAFVQLVGSFLVGYLIDRLGVRAMLAVNFVCSAASYALLAHATTLQHLFLSKLPAAFMAGFLCAQTAAAKMTPAGSERATALGRLTSAYTIGATVGPALGGLLGTYAAAALAVVGSGLAACLVALLPASVDADDEAQAADGGAKAVTKASWPARVQKILPLVWPFLLTKLVSGLVNSAMGAARPLLLKDTFHLDAAKLGIFMSTVFFGNALLGVQLGRISSAAGGGVATVRICLGVLGFGYLTIVGPVLIVGDAALGGTVSLIWFLGVTLALALAQFPLATTLTAESTACVAAPLKGTLVGIEHAIFAFAAMVAPPIGIRLLQLGGLAGIAGLSSLVYLAVWASWCRPAPAVPVERHASDGETSSLLNAKPADLGEKVTDASQTAGSSCTKRSGNHKPQES